MACFDRASPALKETLLKIHSAQKPTEMDQRLFEFGAVEYHIKSSSSDPQYVYLSISSPLLSQEVSLAQGISPGTVQTIKGIHSDMVELIEPATEGYQLTLRLNFYKIPQGKESSKIITEMASIQAAILSCQLKEMLGNVASRNTSPGMYKPIKLVYHPREPFFVARQPGKTTAVFPMRFQEKTDVIIATAFFQELMDVGSSEAWAKVPLCAWSPIPPPELRGEQMEDLSTNGGFVSFDILPHHVKGKRLDKIVWNLLNFYAFVKYHVKVIRMTFDHRLARFSPCYRCHQQTDSSSCFRFSALGDSYRGGCESDWIILSRFCTRQAQKRVDMLMIPKPKLQDVAASVVSFAFRNLIQGDEDVGISPRRSRDCAARLKFGDSGASGAGG
ncbi:hypothetical protein EUGRSUZ_H00135 [Eucalyptus grandis]|uniref:Arp2/3 complex 34 kDa subunit n=2 Tax=Eucalyptus grandis TaxID=71139 RepID=A0A059AV92_EUCGR|nr:hypothetical protein EUGRSUZ_H00135 [Eucalyptus grandis]